MGAVALVLSNFLTRFEADGARPPLRSRCEV